MQQQPGTRTLKLPQDPREDINLLRRHRPFLATVRRSMPPFAQPTPQSDADLLLLQRSHAASSPAWLQTLLPSHARCLASRRLVGPSMIVGD